ncbi:MAG: DUF4070 domain-containing protein, partial [Deltaproteobacteria bacterium]|nr:DUF4070 domain-containing protein [Deltaproteobacteria bacterium]
GIFAKYRASYWRFLGGALLRTRRHLGVAVTLAIMGHHFFVLARRLDAEGREVIPVR